MGGITSSRQQHRSSSAQMWSLSCDNSLAAFWDLKGVKLICIDAHCFIFFLSINAKRNVFKNHAKLVVALRHLPRHSLVLDPSATSLGDSVARRGERAGLHLVPIYSSRRGTRSVVHLSLMLHDESLINSCNLGTEAACPFCVGKCADIDILCPASTSAGRLPVFLPGEVRTGEGEITAVPHRSDRINAQTEEKQNKKKCSFIASEMLRCLGRDSVKVVMRGSTVLAGYRCDTGSLWGDQGAGEACICNAEEFAECSFSPRRAREREMCVLSDCLRTFFCFSYFLWNTAEQEKKNSHSGRRSSWLGECFASQMIHKSFFSKLKICANNVQLESFRELIKA